ncbi:hypothetical protein BASA82_000112 [Batrachochytrium salamandrivorans]|nr:hypothetical protein BASA82_000112 [Batrachochytrium salamandrivorans]
MFSKILIANRGEIAVRIIKTCKRMGVKTCVVFSDADRFARHVQFADEAVYIGKSPATESYLCGDKIVDAALMTGAQAIHPGYGFLSENASFAKLVEGSGLRFIGPPSEAIVQMGSKMGSKRIMSLAGVPITPGYHGEDQTYNTLLAQAEQCGFPLMLKADAGGGGKGMRIVESLSDFPAKLESCKREALASFKDDKILMERYVREGRHVEVQVFGDLHNNYVSIFERDCSVQRRHQKVFEEAPALALPLAMREAMARAAVDAARAVKYVGAGTRPLKYVQQPKEVPGGNVRVETGFGQGDEVSIFYDPMIAKLVVHGKDRGEALQRMSQALREYQIAGLSTNLDFLFTCLHHPEFQVGREVTTRFIQQYQDELIAPVEFTQEVALALCVARALRDERQHPSTAAWFGRGLRNERVVLAGETHMLEFFPTTSNSGGGVQVELKSSGSKAIGTLRKSDGNGDGAVEFDLEVVGGRRVSLKAFWAGDRDVYLFTSGQLPRLTYHAQFLLPDFSAPEDGSPKPSAVSAPMPGKVIQVLVKVGDLVEHGQTVVVMEAMKMEHQLKSPRKGKVVLVAAAPGDVVQDSQQLVRIE